jgi:hypothetical protein
MAREAAGTFTTLTFVELATGVRAGDGRKTTTDSASSASRV